MANCTKCDNGIVTEVDGVEVFKWKCGCKSPAFWAHRRVESKKRRHAVIKGHGQKVGV